MKIPCSVSMLTFNSEAGLAACLESLKEFQEIIVCDGNSTDRTRDIARAFGARVIKQYDTDEPKTPCACDKAAVRQRAMAASSLPWRFFMDSDDALSRGAVEEIRSIVTDPRPTHLVWRMPTHIFIGGETITGAREIKHEATYPSYQTRLVHEKVGTHFKGAVHEHLIFDTKKFPVGTMRSFYDFHWPQDRVDNFWKYQKTYVARELAVSEFPTFGHFLRWGVWYRVRIIAGYVLWRLPAMYLRWGFKDSMPLSLELQIVGYHCLLLFGSSKKYIITRRWWVLGSRMLRGDSLGEARQAFAARALEAYGKTLLIGTPRERARVLPYIKKTRWHRITEASPQEADLRQMQEKEFDTVIRCADIQ